MAKIDYEDTFFQEETKKKRGGLQKIIGFFLIAVIVFLLGVAGGVGGVFFFSSSNNPWVSKLGLSQLQIPTVITQKINIEESSAIIETTKKVSSSVVSITLKTTTTDIFGQTYQSSGAGTGFIITSDGLILTNKHVASNDSASYSVVLNDGTTYDATIQSVDPVYDLAVLKIDARNLPVVNLGDSDQLQVGQWVVAVGNALGQFDNTVTAGIISAKDRKITASDQSGGNSETLNNLLQTDAAINSGNSGGPLVNLAGQVVGINTAVASGAQSIGFAIPINTAKSAIDSIKSTGKIVRPYLGVRYVEITPAIAKSANLTVDYGALVQRGSGLTSFAVVPGSPADKAGIAENDIILEVNGTRINQANPLLSLIQKFNVGDTVTLKVLTKGEEKEVKVVLEASQ